MTTRQSILDAAAAMFARNGYALTRLSDIADSVGMHLTGLYYYYDSKEALVSDIITYVPTRVSSALEQALDALPPTATHRQRIETAFAAYLEAILKDDAYVRAEHRIAAQLAPKLRKRSLKVAQEINELWRKLLEDAVAAGEVRSDIDMTMLRMLMIGSMNWAVEWFRPGMAPPSYLANAMQTLFFDGAATPTGKAARSKASHARVKRAK